MKMTPTLLSSLFSQYTNEKAISYLALPKTTSGNDAFVITTESRKYVLRTLAHSGGITADEEYELQTALQRADIVTPLYLKTISGDLTAQANGIICTLSGYIDGEQPSTISTRLIRDMGTTLANIQNAIGHTSVAANTLQWFDPKNIAQQLQQYDGPLKQQAIQHIANSSIILNMDLPKTVIHGDLHSKNTFAKNHRVTAVFDFETAAYTVRILDIARTYLTFVKVTPFSPRTIMQLLIGGYDSAAIQPLSTQEKKAFSMAVTYVAVSTALSIYNNGNAASSAKYLQLADAHSRQAQLDILLSN